MTQSSVFQRFGHGSQRVALAALLLAAIPTRAEKTLMILVDWWLQQPMDTVINLQVFQPTSEIKMLDGSKVPDPTLTKAYTTENRSWWYVLKNFNPDAYAMGRVRFNTLYLRGWYQNDSTYKAAAGDTIYFNDTVKTFAYQNTATGQNVTVTLPTETPKFFVFPAAGTYRGPKLYTSQGNSGTEILNMRPQDSKGATLPGGLDKCLDTIPSDTVWLRWGTPTNPPGQQPSAASMQCTGYNPFSTRAALVYLRNPWPGAEQPVVEFNGQNVPMFPSTNPDWLVADLRYIKGGATPSNTIRFKKSASSNIYFDSAGLEQGAAKPFVLPTLSAGAAYYFVPPEAGAPIVTGTAPGGKLPVPSYTIYVQNPWKPGSPRLMWESDKNLHVMRPTQKCGWYSYPLYGAPTKVLIGHSFEDSVYGANGVQFRTRENWIDLSGGINDKKEVWIQTLSGGSRIPAKATTTPEIKDCSTDQLTLVMKAYDFKGRGEAGGNPSFQIGGVADAKGATSSGLAKGMVLSTLKNGLPVYSGRDSGYQVGGINKTGPANALPLAQNLWGKSTPSNWFDPVALKAAVPGIAIGQTCLEVPLKRTPADNGYYVFNNQNYFPLDTISDKSGYSLMKDAKDADHNFLYCLHGHASFEYTPGLKFEFRGDDDVWVFINNKLAVDLGGVHGPESASVNLDKMKLREGGVYPFDIFYCERQSNGSSILIRTTMDLQPSWQYRADPTTTGGKLQIDIFGKKTTNYVPSCADLNTGTELPWEKTSGRMVIVGPEGSELNETYTQDASLYDGNLVYAVSGQIVADTNKLKTHPQLMWPGTYTIRVESKLGDSLYAFTFTKMYGAVNVTGTVLDANGDGVADSIQLSAPRAIFGDDPSYHLVWFKANGSKDSIVVDASKVRKINDSLVMAPLAGKAWGVRTELPSGVKPDSLGAVLTSPSGINVANPIKLVDGIAPIADSARLSYGVGGAPDTLRIWANEASQENGGATASDVWAKIGTSSVPRNLKGGDYTSFDGGRGLLLVLPATHGIGFSDSLRLAGKVSDQLGNAATNSSVWVPILSNALGAAFLYDENGDGQADSLGVQLRGSLSGVATVKVNWKDASGASVSKTWTVSGSTSGSFGVSGSGNAFPKGATSCKGGGCTVVFQDASGDAIQTWPLIDSVPPIILSGSYELGTSTDTLRVKFSEPVTKISKDPTWIEWGSKGAFAATLDHKDMDLDGTEAAYFVVDTAKGIRASYDSIRLATGSRAGKVKDQFGTPVGANSPWAPFTLGLPPMKVVLLDPKGVGKGTDIEVLPVRNIPDEALKSITKLRVVWTDTSGNSIERTVDFSSLTSDNGKWSGALANPFPFGATACLGSCEVVATSSSASKTWTLVDGVPPTLVKARYRYSGTGVNADTLILRSSEPWVGAKTSDLSPFALAGTSDKSRSVVGKSWTISTDGRTQFVVLDSVAAATYGFGDYARYTGGSAAKVVDAAGNRPGDASPWVEIEFGLRPPVLKIKPYPALVDNSSKSGTVWDPPPASIPAVEILVRPAKAVASPSDSGKIDPTGWLLPDGKPAQNDLNKVLGVKILLNRPLEGQLMIYDNIGTFVTSIDLAPMKKAWVADSANKDAMREVWLLWNGTLGDGKFAATGVYIFRAVVKVDNGDGTFEFRNLVWRLGWHRDAK